MRSLRMVACGLGLMGGMMLEAPAEAGTWTAGANAGVGVLNSSQSGSDSEVLVGWPSGVSLVGTFQPGLRLGYVFDDLANEMFVNTSLQLVSSNGQTFYMTSNSLNVQHAFGSGGVAPYVDVGAGFVTVGGSGSSESDATYGGGIGLRRMVSGGHGALRAEVRADAISVSQAQNTLYTIGLQLGFDLWFK